MKLLNIGCGDSHHPDWTNIDLVSSDPSVIVYDIRRGLPFPDRTFDVVYHSHVIEHLEPHKAQTFLQDCFRVLKPGGRIRVVTPDLEVMTRTYLDCLDRASQGNADAEDNHAWMVLEMFDQMTRSRSGGAMGDYLRNPKLINKNFVLSRIGQEAQYFFDPEAATSKPKVFRPLSLNLLSKLAARARYEFISAILLLLAGPSGKRAFQIGLFRNSGEIHQQLYDRLSLATLLRRSGFTNISQFSADHSLIPEFNSYQLDTIKGMTRKPDSLFMEAARPT